MRRIRSTTTTTLTCRRSSSNSEGTRKVTSGSSAEIIGRRPMTSTSVDPERVAEAVEAVRERIRSLVGARPVHLIAVTKGFGADAICAAAAAGCTMVGENYAQEVNAKVAELRKAAVVLPQVHFIGQLQTNKVRQLTAVVDVWQSIDRDHLATEIARRAPGANVFIQVNATDEAGKGGCRPASVEGLVSHCRTAGLVVLGLMTVGPTSADRRRTSSAFALVRQLADDNDLTECSMGMSADLDLALENGATHLRIGSALFGARPDPRRSIR